MSLILGIFKVLNTAPGTGTTPQARDAAEPLNRSKVIDLLDIIIPLEKNV